MILCVFTYELSLNENEMNLSQMLSLSVFFRVTRRTRQLRLTPVFLPCPVSIAAAGRITTAQRPAPPPPTGQTASWVSPRRIKAK